jgi:uncharacterized protein (TIGR03435 family)
VKRPALGVVACTLCLAAALLSAQDAREFEVVSVRRSPAVTAGSPNDPVSIAQSRSKAPRATFLVLPDGRFEARNQSLAALTSVAFSFDQIAGSKGVVDPSAQWMSIDQFDVIGATGRPWTTPPPGTNVPAELRTMLRTMLEDRFALRARIGTRSMSVLVLQLAKPDKLGPAIRLSSAECRARASASLSPTASQSPGCPPPDMTSGIQLTAVTMTELADIISKEGRFRDLGPFVDQTGRAGLYDVSFSFKTWLPKYKWTKEELLGLLSDQLSVKLKQTSLPFPTLTIEKARKPLED